MARITHIKKAQQRYAQVVVTDDDGQPKKSPVMVRNRDGELVQKTTKRGAPVFVTLKVADKTQPLPNRKCEKCGNEITVGSPYKYVSPKSGPYGGRTSYRCEACPNWQVWELSNSLSARIAQLQNDWIVSADSDWDEDQVTSDWDEDQVTSHMAEAAEAIRELAEEKREAAQNIEDGFGHATYQSDDLNQIADDLDGWADDVESMDVPEKPAEPDDEENEDDEDSVQEWDEYRAELDSWVDEVSSAIDAALSESPC